MPEDTTDGYAVNLKEKPTEEQLIHAYIKLGIVTAKLTEMYEQTSKCDCEPCRMLTESAQLFLDIINGELVQGSEEQINAMVERAGKAVQ